MANRRDMVTQRSKATSNRAVDLSRDLARGAISALEVAEACLSRIGEQEPAVRAWAHLDPHAVREQAAAADRRRRDGQALSPLDGIPVGIKDNIDTGDAPTEMGSPIHAGRRPERDALIVRHLRSLGMVILGKTVTTPFGMNAPAPTRNPLYPGHTLGASSVGSAAAVAAGMVPLTVNTQNTSSTTRPASYAGVPAYKPSHGLIALDGCLAISPPVTHLAFIANALEDLALLADHAVTTNDHRVCSPPSDESGFLARCRAESEAPLRLALVKGPWWHLGDSGADRALMQFAERLGIAETLDLPRTFERALQAHADIVAGDMAVTLEAEYTDSKARLPEEAVTYIEKGHALTAADYARALRLRTELYGGLLAAMEGYDAILTLSTPGAPPRLEDGIGDGAFSMPWTFLGLPTLSLPLLADPEGLPIGLQVVARRNDDHRLFAAGSRLAAG